MLDFFLRWLYEMKKTVLEMDDDELVSEIANLMDVSEETVIQIACREICSTMTYDDFFRTGKLTPELRQELRLAYPKVLESFG